MSPLEFAQNLAKSEDLKDRALAVGIIARGLSDEDPKDPFRQPWPLDTSIRQAIKYLGLNPTNALVSLATIMAPKISDAMLNREPR